MNLVIDDPTPDDEPERAEAPMESLVRACVICGKPAVGSDECPACEDREWRKWEGR